MPESDPDSIAQSYANHPTQPAVRLRDVLTADRALTSFAAFARPPHDSLDAEPAGGSGRTTTVLAPLNSAIEGLPRKPWEEDGGGGAETVGRDQADARIRRFVDAHLVPRCPWPEHARARTLAGREVWWETDAGGRRVVMPDGIEVDRVAIEVGNGQIWVLKGVLKTS